jgi:hypothetical protein
MHIGFQQPHNFNIFFAGVNGTDPIFFIPFALRRIEWIPMSIQGLLQRLQLLDVIIDMDYDVV